MVQITNYNKAEPWRYSACQSQIITFCPRSPRSDVVLGFSWEHDMQSVPVDGCSLFAEKTEDNLKKSSMVHSEDVGDKNPVHRILVPLQEVSDHAQGNRTGRLLKFLWFSCFAKKDSREGSRRCRWIWREMQSISDCFPSSPSGCSDRHSPAPVNNLHR